MKGMTEKMKNILFKDSQNKEYDIEPLLVFGITELNKEKGDRLCVIVTFQDKDKLKYSVKIFVDTREELSMIINGIRNDFDLDLSKYEINVESNEGQPDGDV